MLVIRMRRVGSKKRPFFRIVVTEHSAPRDGAFKEVVGTYNPRTNPEALTLDRERIAYWVSQGARPSDTVRTLIARVPKPVAEAAPAAEQGASA
ncbi:MAG: 30S ribosomal protein S16 [Acidobacteriota bacterium]|nr:30S ribosomal protein S16 [Acidobacteriota bacterium]